MACAIQAYAELSVTTSRFPTSNQCNGRIYVTAEGTAGPFVIKILSKDGTQSITTPSVNGTRIINTLCRKDYDVVAINKFGCDHFIGEVLFSSFNLKEEETELRSIPDQVSSEHNLNVSPNPFKDQFSVSMTSNSIMDVRIDCYNSTGAKIISSQRRVEEGENTINIDMLRDKAPGVYFIGVSSNDKAILRRFKVLKVE